MKASLILITYNSIRTLPTFFDTLKQTESVTYEVVAVDNASSDGTLAFLHQQPQLRVIANRENRGFGQAANQGAAIADGDVLVFLNPDVWFTPQWLLQLQQTLVREPQAGIICPATLFPGQPIPPAIQLVRDRVPGSAMLVRRAVWQQLGGFDPQIFLYWEDTDLCWRAWLAGYRVIADHAAIVYHERGGSGGGNRWVAEYTRNGIYVHLKLMPWRRVWRFVGRQAMASLARMARGANGIPAAWWWNLRHLGSTYRQRRRLLGQKQHELSQLDRLIE
jgi:GT2 family glycosyltransferase